MVKVHRTKIQEMLAINSCINEAVENLTQFCDLRKDLNNPEEGKFILANY